MQAVIRVSKQYLPNMACGLEHPKVKVHIGDGFKFLEQYKNAFDVIITDSSDPDGPAENLFEKKYFQMLSDALRPGGVITTQGCMSPSLGILVMTGAPTLKNKRKKIILSQVWNIQLSQIYIYN